MIYLFSILIIGVIGAFFGSFLNVVIDRIPQKRSLLWGRSMCDSCKLTLAPYDLIPVFSYLFLRGKCRSCKAVIPPRIFFVEILTGGIWIFLLTLSSLHIIVFAEFLYLLVISSIFIAIFFTDISYGVIPDQLNILLVVIIFGYLLFFNIDGIWLHIFSSLGIGLLFFLLFIFTKGKGMGFGDVKFSFILGLFLGFPNIIVGFYAAFLTGAVVSLILVIYGRKNFKNGTIPFGPFLVASGFFSYIFGSAIIGFFTRSFF